MAISFCFARLTETQMLWDYPHTTYGISTGTIWMRLSISTSLILEKFAPLLYILASLAQRIQRGKNAFLEYQIAF
jgi:hypothetical protein